MVSKTRISKKKKKKLDPKREFLLKYQKYNVKCDNSFTFYTKLLKDTLITFTQEKIVELNSNTKHEKFIRAKNTKLHTAAQEMSIIKVYMLKPTAILIR